jgi:hypothetical protein
MVSPFRTNMRILEVSSDNAISIKEPKRQKMAVLAVQANGTVLIVEQWVPVTVYQKGEDLMAAHQLEPGTLTKNEMKILSHNLNFLSTAQNLGGEVLLSIQIGNSPVLAASSRRGSIPAVALSTYLPVVKMVAGNTFDEALTLNKDYVATYKIELPHVGFDDLVVAIQLTDTNVESYQKKFNGQDPIQWKPLSIEVGLEEEVQEDTSGTLSAANFFDF